MDFLSNLAKNVGSKPEPESDKPAEGHDSSSGGGLFADAKLVAEAAQSQFRNEPDKYDKAKVASSAANILEAASDYAKLDETQGIGKYVGQAEGYLRKYNTSAAAVDPDKHEPAGPVKESGGSEAAVPPAAKVEKPVAGSEAAVPPAAVEAEKPVGGSEGAVLAAAEEAEKPVGGSKGAVLAAAEEAEKPVGGKEEYIKVAEGLLNKASEDSGKAEGSSESEGGYGDLMKMAGGFLKK